MDNRFVTLSTPEKALFELKQDALTWAVNTTGTNGEVGVTGLTTNHGVIVTAQAAAEAFYVTVGTGSFVVKASDDNAPIVGLKIAWCKVG
jgi:hypothetical protein